MDVCDKGLVFTSRSGTVCVLWPLFWTFGCYLSVFATEHITEQTTEYEYDIKVDKPKSAGYVMQNLRVPAA